MQPVTVRRLFSETVDLRLITHAGCISADVGIAFSCVCLLSVCLSVCLSAL